MSNQNNWGGARANTGGKRAGSGRKKIYDTPPKHRGFSCTDEEWETIKAAAKKSGITIKKMIVESAREILATD